MPDHDPQQWRIAVALGLACGLDSARWAAGWTAPCTCDPYKGDDGLGSRLHHNSKCVDPGALRERGHLAIDERRYVERRAVPVPAPWDADAYRADCARRGVQPGPMPALSHVDGRTLWEVNEHHTVVRVGVCRCSVWRDGDVYVSADEGGPTRIEDLTRAVELARVAADAMKEPTQ